MDSPTLHHNISLCIVQSWQTAYQLFDQTDVLTLVKGYSGQDSTQVNFRYLLRLRDARLSENDWKCLMKRTVA